MNTSCAVDGCGRNAVTRGWCNTHYERWRLGRSIDDPGDLRSRPRPKVACSIDGCERTAKTRGWCPLHYGRWYATGEPGTAEVRRYRSGGRRVDANGYVRLWRPGHVLADDNGEVMEHRLVVWERGDDPQGREVHHINGDRTDNRSENLEVMDNGAHQRHHHAKDGAVIVNQHGTFPVRRASGR